MKHNKHFIIIFFGLIFSLIFFTGSNAQPVWPSYIAVSSQAAVNAYGTMLSTGGYTSVSGTIYIGPSSDITDLTPFNCITSVGGDLKIYENSVLTNLNGLGNITSIGGNIRINDNAALTNLNGMESLTSVGGNIQIYTNAALTNLGLENLASVFGYLYLTNNAALTNLGLGSLESIGGDLAITSAALTNLGLGSLTSVGGTLGFNGDAALPNLAGLESLTSVGGELSIQDNAVLTNIDGLESLTSIGGELSIQNNAALTNIDSLASLTSVGGYITINNNAALTNLDGLGNLTSVGGSLYITTNPALVQFCGLYHLVSTGTYGYLIITNDNGAYPTADQILAAGPCITTTAVAVDIKPGSCPNPLNVNEKGKIPVAILGTDDFDVNNIDTTTLQLEGISPLHCTIEDVATPVSGGQQCDCTTDGPDGFNDLSLKFDAQALVGALGQVNDGDTLVLTLTGNMLDGTHIEGSDCVIIKAKNLGKDVSGNLSNVPKEYALFDNYPNPFNPTTQITYQIPKPGNVELKVYDMLGREVATLVDGYKAVGKYNVEFDASRLASGLYIYRLQSGNFISTKKMILMK